MNLKYFFIVSFQLYAHAIFCEILVLAALIMAAFIDFNFINSRDWDIKTLLELCNELGCKKQFWILVWVLVCLLNSAKKLKFSIKDSFSKCDQIYRKLRIWSHLLKKSLMENFIFCLPKFSEMYLGPCLTSLI